MHRTLFALSLLAATALGCSAAGPPMISDTDSAPPPTDGYDAAPCTDPAPGCPCQEVGKQYSCGTIYRISGTHVDCSPGYYTCQEDGGWSDCVGPSIFDGG
ncbi:MAG TPA: hypothetical protein VGH28_07600 [Polyangiaceae bacterium]